MNCAAGAGTLIQRAREMLFQVSQVPARQDAAARWIIPSFKTSTVQSARPELDLLKLRAIAVKHGFCVCDKIH